MKQMPKITKLFLLLSLFLNAGDPCPVDFKFVDAGMPDWLNPSSVLGKLKHKAFWLGVRYVTKLQDDNTLGVQITHVYPHSPAANAGLRAGDLITKIDGMPISLQERERPFDAVLKKKRFNDLLTLTLLRDKKPQNVSLVLDQVRDPLILTLKEELLKERTPACTHVENRVLTKEEKKKVHAAVFLKNKRFDCNYAHKKLAAIEGIDADSKGSVFVVRGSKRILFAHVGRKTLCVNYRDNLTQSQRREILSALFDDYIADRYAHP